MMQRILFILVLASGPLTESTHAAAVDYFLQIDGVDGESTDNRHRNTIEIQSFRWSITQSGVSTNTANGGGGAGKVSYSDISFSASASKASPKLMLFCATGQHLPSANLFVRRPGGDTNDYIKVTLEDCLITSYHIGGSGASTAIPTDQFALNFTKITFAHTTPNGRVTSGEAIRPRLQ